MNLLIDEIGTETGPCASGEAIDLSYWALLAESYQPGAEIPMTHLPIQQG